MSLRQILTRSVGDEVNANDATNTAKSRIDAVPDGDDDRDLEGAARFDMVKRVVVKRRLYFRQESCRTKRWKVPNTVAKVRANSCNKSVSPLFR